MCICYQSNSRSYHKVNWSVHLSVGPILSSCNLASSITSLEFHFPWTSSRKWHDRTVEWTNSLGNLLFYFMDQHLRHSKPESEMINAGFAIPEELAEYILHAFTKISRATKSVFKVLYVKLDIFIWCKKIEVAVGELLNSLVAIWRSYSGLSCLHLFLRHLWTCPNRMKQRHLMMSNLKILKKNERASKSR